MQFDTVPAHTVEKGDYLNLGGEESFLVAEVSDNDNVSITLLDDEGMAETFYFDPFEDLTIVTRFDEEVEFEEVDPD